MGGRARTPQFEKMALTKESSQKRKLRQKKNKLNELLCYAQASSLPHSRVSSIHSGMMTGLHESLLFDRNTGDSHSNTLSLNSSRVSTQRGILIPERLKVEYKLDSNKLLGKVFKPVRLSTNKTQISNRSQNIEKENNIKIDIRAEPMILIHS